MTVEDFWNSTLQLMQWLGIPPAHAWEAATYATLIVSIGVLSTATYYLCSRIKRRER